MKYAQTIPPGDTGGDTGTKPRDGVIVLTGSTGFLGSHLLQRLLERDGRRIVCLVRAESADGARQRGVAAFEESNQRSLTPSEAQRIRWQRADLEEARCGMSTIRWQALADEVTEIFHCAASTRFDLPLDEAQRINVDGVIHLHALAAAAARHHAFGRFHHVSTAYASGRTSGLVGPDHLPTDRARNFRNTYERTKARAERFLRAQADVAVTIYRPSIVAGDSVSGSDHELERALLADATDRRRQTPDALQRRRCNRRRGLRSTWWPTGSWRCPLRPRTTWRQRGSMRST